MRCLFVYCTFDCMSVCLLYIYEIFADFFFLCYFQIKKKYFLINVLQFWSGDFLFLIFHIQLLLLFVYHPNKMTCVRSFLRSWAVVQSLLTGRWCWCCWWRQHFHTTVKKARRSAWTELSWQSGRKHVLFIARDFCSVVIILTIHYSIKFQTICFLYNIEIFFGFVLFVKA